MSATRPDVSGTVESHRSPIAAEKASTTAVVGGASTNRMKTTPREK